MKIPPPIRIPLLLLCAVTLSGAILTEATLAGAGDATPGASGVAVAPGSLVRWEGEGTERCGLGGNEWSPLGTTCFFPVDLLRDPGPLRLSRWIGGRREQAVVTVTDYPYPTQEIHLRDDGQVHLSAANLARVEREQERVGALWSRRGPALFTLPLGPPLTLLPAGGRFGSRRIFNGESRSPHSGADYSARQGTPVLAAADGTVALAEDHFFSGKSVFLDHGDGLITMYFHLSAIRVEEGQSVRRGQPIGAVGATGRATGPHLHFGVRWRGARIDPRLLLGAPTAIPVVP